MIPSSDWLEEASNRNLVGFYESELSRGKFKALSSGARANMRKFGILELQHQKKWGFKLELSEYGLRLLEEVKNE